MSEIFERNGYARPFESKKHLQPWRTMVKEANDNGAENNRNLKIV
jgi:hypothetical protein